MIFDDVCCRRKALASQAKTVVRNLFADLLKLVLSLSLQATTAWGLMEMDQVCPCYCERSRQNVPSPPRMTSQAQVHHA